MVYVESPKILLPLLLLVVFGGAGGWFYHQYTTGAFQAEVLFEQNQEVHHAEPLVVDFTRSMDPQSFAGVVTVEPQVAASVAWNRTGTQMQIIPKKGWLRDTQYTVSIGSGITQWRVPFDGTSVTFRTDPLPKAKSVTVRGGEEKGVVSLYDPLHVTFDSSLEHEDVIVTSEPEAVFVIETGGPTEQLSIVPQERLTQGETYTITVAVRSGDTQSLPFQTVATTRVRIATEEDVRSLPYEQRISYARAYAEPTVEEGKYIEVNRASQTIAIYEDGKLVDAYIVSSGAPGFDTPQGNYQIYNKHPRAWSNKYGLYMPYWMAFTSDGAYGFHELPEWPGGYKEGEDHLGTPVSHGCVRLGIGPAERIYEWAEVGTPVTII